MKWKEVTGLVHTLTHRDTSIIVCKSWKDWAWACWVCLYLIVSVCLLEIETKSVYNCVFSGSTGALRCSIHTGKHKNSSHSQKPNYTKPAHCRTEREGGKRDRCTLKGKLQKMCFEKPHQKLPLWKSACKFSLTLLSFSCQSPSPVEQSLYSVTFNSLSLRWIHWPFTDHLRQIWMAIFNSNIFKQLPGLLYEHTELCDFSTTKNWRSCVLLVYWDETTRAIEDQVSQFCIKSLKDIQSSLWGNYLSWNSYIMSCLCNIIYSMRKIFYTYYFWAVRKSDLHLYAFSTHFLVHLFAFSRSLRLSCCNLNWSAYYCDIISFR